MVDVQSKWKFYWYEQRAPLTMKSTDCKITTLQMLNNNYGNAHSLVETIGPRTGQMGVCIRSVYETKQHLQ